MLHNAVRSDTFQVVQLARSGPVNGSINTAPFTAPYLKDALRCSKGGTPLQLRLVRSVTGVRWIWPSDCIGDLSSIDHRIGYLSQRGAVAVCMDSRRWRSEKSAGVGREELVGIQRPENGSVQAQQYGRCRCAD